MKVHDLKSWPEHFKSVLDGTKTFEARKNDRNFQVGDNLLLREWQPRSNVYAGDYTGREVTVEVTHMLHGADQPKRYGIADGFCVMSIKPIQPITQIHNVMKVLTPGHRYELQNFEQADQPGQVLQFIEKELDPMNPGTLRTVNDGTTNEELLRVLIDRLQHLNNKMPCRENSLAITHAEDALLRLEDRTAKRKARGVEGTAQA